jgi:hypothetical protein
MIFIRRRIGDTYNDDDDDEDQNTAKIVKASIKWNNLENNRKRKDSVE